MVFDPLTITLALVAALFAGLVGSFALMKRIVLAGDVISHIALPGIGLAFLYHINPLLGGTVTLLLGTVLIWHLEKRTGLSTDAMIGVVFAASVAVGALVTPEEDLVEALFGGLASPTIYEFIIGLVLALLTIAFLLKFKDRLILTLFSPELAASSGVNVNRLNLLFLLVFSLTIVLGLKFLGALLVGSLIIIPAAIGRQLTHTLPSFLLASSLASIASVAAGMFFALAYGASLGPAVVTVAAALFGLSLLKKKR